MFSLQSQWSIVGAPEKDDFKVPVSCPRCAANTNEGIPFCTRCKFDLQTGRLDSKKYYCAYCGNWDKMSEEHVFPRWIQNKFPLRFKETHHVTGRRGSYEGNLQPKYYTVKGKNSNKRHPYKNTIKYACANCNNGWMSVLQSKTKDNLYKLARGEWPDLNNEERFISSRWCAMSTTSLEHGGGSITIPNFQRTCLKNGGMPQGWNIFVGRVDDSECAGFSHHRSMSIPGLEGAFGQGLRFQSTIFCIENALFYCFSSCMPLAFALIWQVIGWDWDAFADHHGLMQIWPTYRPTDIAKNVRFNREKLRNIQASFGPINEEPSMK